MTLCEFIVKHIGIFSNIGGKFVRRNINGGLKALSAIRRKKCKTRDEDYGKQRGVGLFQKGSLRGRMNGEKDMQGSTENLYLELWDRKMRRRQILKGH